MAITKGINIADEINFAQLRERSALAVMTKMPNNCLIRFARCEINNCRLSLHLKIL